MSIDLHSNGKTSLYANLIKMLNYYNIPFNFNHDNLDDTKILHFVDLMQKKYITHWNIPFAIHKSLNSIIFLKTAIHQRFILMLQEKNPNRKTLETGRYDKISRCDRICPLCSLDMVDAIHFLFNCPKYSSIRDDFF